MVDDDDAVRETVVEILDKNAMFSIKESPNGMDACIKLGSFRPDLLILDIRMPDMSGIEVCKRIKEDSDFSDMKVIIITGFPDGDDAEEDCRYGVWESLHQTGKNKGLRSHGAQSPQWIETDHV